VAHKKARRKVHKIPTLRVLLIVTSRPEFWQAIAHNPRNLVIAGTGRRRLSFFIGDIRSNQDRAKNEPPSRPASKANAAPKEQVNFEKAQGSSRHDEADLRDVARKAAKRSQEPKGT
jgi:hypothetical protein